MFFTPAAGTFGFLDLNLSCLEDFRFQQFCLCVVRIDEVDLCHFLHRIFVTPLCNAFPGGLKIHAQFLLLRESATLGNRLTNCLFVSFGQFILLTGRAVDLRLTQAFRLEILPTFLLHQPAFFLFQPMGFHFCLAFRFQLDALLFCLKQLSLIFSNAALLIFYLLPVFFLKALPLCFFFPQFRFTRCAILLVGKLDLPLFFVKSRLKLHLNALLFCLQFFRRFPFQSLALGLKLSLSVLVNTPLGCLLFQSLAFSLRLLACGLFLKARRLVPPTDVFSGF